MRHALLVGIFSLGFMPGLSLAGPLMRCVGADGVPQYVQSKPAGSTCAAVKAAPPPPSNPYRPNISPRPTEAVTLPAAAGIPNWTPGPISPATLSPTGQALPLTLPSALPPLPLGPTSSATLPPVALPPLPDATKR